MNKFLSDIQNFATASHDVVDKFLRERCEGINLYQAMRLGNELAKAGKAMSSVNQLIYKIDEER